MSLDICFNDLSFTIKAEKSTSSKLNCWKAKKSVPKPDQVILDSVSGQFNGGRLTAIMGPSGAGKVRSSSFLKYYWHDHS
jgi:ABC-type multidrug transport system ATPase subunit